MAGNRLEKIGTIFTRASGLLKSGAMKPSEKPLWFEVYDAFPPKFEPRFDRTVQEKPIRQILYPEDLIRAQFYKKYGSPGSIQLSDVNQRPTLCQRFLEEYSRLESEGITPTENLMDEAALALEAKGLYLDRSRAPPKSETVEDAPSPPQEEKQTGGFRGKVRLADIFKESQED